MCICGKGDYRQWGEESGLVRDPGRMRRVTEGEKKGGREKDREGKREGHSAEREHRTVITQIQLTPDCCSIAVILHS